MGVDTVFNRANKRFKDTFTSGATADDLRAEPGEFTPVLADGEGVHHICSSTDGIEHETDRRTTTMEPGGDADAHLIVTDRHVLGVLGDDTSETVFTFETGAVTRAVGRDGLLSSTLEVSTAGETVRLRPDDGTDVERVAARVERIGTAWDDLETALMRVESAIDEFEQRVAEGTDPDTALTSVRSRLSKAHHCATRDDLTPEDVMLAEVEPIEATVDGLRVTTRLERGAERLDDAEAAREDDPEAAVIAAMAAADRLGTARDVHGEIGSSTISKRLTELTVRLDAVCESLLVDARECCGSATVADGPEAALAGWERAMDRYRTMLDAGWDGQAGVPSTAIRYQLAWVLGNRLDALVDIAAEREAASDECGDTEAYEQAIDRLEEAATIAAQCPFGTGVTYTDAVERLEDKIVRSEWQWGER